MLMVCNVAMVCNVNGEHANHGNIGCSVCLMVNGLLDEASQDGNLKRDAENHRFSGHKESDCIPIE